MAYDWLRLGFGALGLVVAAVVVADEPFRSPSELGRELFLHEWKRNDALSPDGDGLGPVFNAKSCIACHEQGGAGGAGDNRHNVDVFCLLPATNAVRTGRENLIDEVRKIHPGMVRGTAVLSAGVLHRHGEHATYDTWRAETLALGDVALDAVSVRIHQRSTPALFGVGQIDAVPPKLLAALVKKQAASRSPVKGRLAVASERNAGPGKFGWRGQTASLKEFVMGACANELGLQVPEHAQPVDPLVGGATSQGLDLTQQQCDALVAYVRALPAPEPRQTSNSRLRDTWDAGRQLFGRVGCAECHVTKLGAVDGIYSDLLLHDMGIDLADTAGANPESGIVSVAYYGSVSDILVSTPPEETRRLWRTTPLWGVNLSAPYLHDGRAATLDAAILAHGGEATQSRQAYQSLAPAHRAKLLAFLDSLGPEK